MSSCVMARVAAVALIGAAACGASADTKTFLFAQQGQAYSAFLPGDDPVIGQEIAFARIYLDVESFPGSDAADFFTDISFPIDPFPGKTSALSLFGADLGWSGEGTFHYFIETTDFNGLFISRRFGAETFSDTFKGRILDGSRIEFTTTVPAPAGIVPIVMLGLGRRRRA